MRNRKRKTRKTSGGGSAFTTFITSDNNHEYKKVGNTWMKTMKGLDVKLKKDKNGNPTAWFIRPNDNNVLAKLFNTKKKGIVISHARFCKKFMGHDSLLGKRYPHLISKVNAKNITCRDHGPDHGARRDITLKRTSPTVKPVSNRNPVVIEPKYEYLMLDTMTDDSNVTDLPVIPANRPLVARPPVIRPSVVRPLVARPLVIRPSVVRPPVIRPLIARPSVIRPLVARPSVIPAPNMNPVPKPRADELTFSHLMRTSTPATNRFGPTSYLIQPQLQPRHNYSQADLDTMLAMGFDQTKAMHALKKYNNIAKAIDACLRDDNPHNPITRNERHGNAFATLIQSREHAQSDIRHFVVVDNGGSGDCLFLSLAETLMRAGKIPPNADLRGSAFDLRQKIVDYVMKNLNHYFIRSTEQTFQDAIDMGVDVNGQTLYMHNYEYEMRKQHTYGTEIEIAAAAQIYAINIYVVNTNGIGWDQPYIGDPTTKNTWANTWANTWYIFNMNKGHYTSLRCTDGPGKCPN